MQKKFKTALLASVVLLGGLGLTSLTSCSEASEQNAEVETFEIKLDDAIEIPTLLESKGIIVNEGTLYSSENRKVVQMIGSRAFALKEGTSRIELTLEDELMYSFDLKVVPYETFDIKEVSKGINVSGDLIDFSAGRCAIKGHNYEFGYEITNSSTNDQDIQVVISNQEVIEHEEVDGVHKIYAKGVGDSIFEIINSDGATVLKIVIKVRPELRTEAEFLMALQKYDYRGSVGLLDGWWVEDSTTVTFTGDNSGIFSGTDQGVALPDVNFTFEMDTEWQDNEMVGFYVKDFSITGSFSCKYMQFFKAGDQLLLYSGLDDSGILLDLYLPKMNK